RSSSGEKPSPLEALHWGSQSTSKVGTSAAASEAARLIAVVVLPTPPFWLVMAKMRMAVCRSLAEIRRMFHVEPPSGHSTSSGRSTWNTQDDAAVHCARKWMKCTPVPLSLAGGPIGRAVPGRPEGRRGSRREPAIKPRRYNFHALERPHGDQIGGQRQTVLWPPL